MHGAEFHGNTRRDSPTRILSIAPPMATTPDNQTRELYFISSCYIYMSNCRIGLYIFSHALSRGSDYRLDDAGDRRD